MRLKRTAALHAALLLHVHVPPISRSSAPACCAPSIDLERSQLVVPISEPGEMTVVVCGTAPLGEVEVRLEEPDTAMTIARVDAMCDDDTLQLRLPLDANAVATSSKEHAFRLVATAACAPDQPARARVVSEAQLRLLMALERQLLFAGFMANEGSDAGHGGAGADGLRRVLALVEASLLQKLRSGAGLTASSVTDDDGGGGLDSASESFASMLDRLRRAAGFSSAPWHEASEVEWAEELMAGVEVVQAELRDSLSQEAEATAPSWESADYEAIAPDWKVQHLWQGGEWLPEAEQKLPRTVALLRRLEERHGLRLNPLQNVACGIARQPAHSGIAPHCDGNLLGLTAHLGLLVPDDCWIEVGGERRAWQEGGVLLMDTTYSHRTANDSPQDRYVLMLNVLRPTVRPSEVVALKHYLDAPSFSLARLNPFYMWAVGTATPTSPPPSVAPGSAFLARSLPSGPTVEVAPGVELPLRRARDEAGLTLVVPLTGQRFRVEGGLSLAHRRLPSDSAALAQQGDAGDGVTSLAGSIVEPDLATVDADGCIEWVGFAVPGECDAVTSGARRDASEADDGSTDEFGIDAATLRAHLRVMEAPGECFTWLAIEDAAGTELLAEVSDEDDGAPEAAGGSPIVENGRDARAVRRGTGGGAGGAGRAVRASKRGGGASRKSKRKKSKKR